MPSSQDFHHLIVLLNMDSASSHHVRFNDRFNDSVRCGLDMHITLEARPTKINDLSRMTRALTVIFELTVMFLRRDLRMNSVLGSELEFRSLTRSLARLQSCQEGYRIPMQSSNIYPGSSRQWRIAKLEILSNISRTLCQCTC